MNEQQGMPSPDILSFVHEPKCAGTRLEPQLLEDIARMEKSETLRRFIDFTKIRQLLAVRPTAKDHNSGWEQETHLARGGIIVERLRGVCALVFCGTAAKAQVWKTHPRSCPPPRSRPRSHLPRNRLVRAQLCRLLSINIGAGFTDDGFFSNIQLPT